MENNNTKRVGGIWERKKRTKVRRAISRAICKQVEHTTVRGKWHGIEYKVISEWIVFKSAIVLSVRQLAKLKMLQQNATRITTHKTPNTIVSVAKRACSTEVFNVMEDLVKLCDSSDVNKYGFSDGAAFFFYCMQKTFGWFDCVCDSIRLPWSHTQQWLRIVHISNGKVVQVLRPQRSNLGIAKAVYLCMCVCVRHKMPFKPSNNLPHFHLSHFLNFSQRLLGFCKITSIKLTCEKE